MGKNLPYLWPFACFNCRHVFKGPADPALVVKHRACPLCAGEGIRLFPKFKAPRKNDLKQWEKVRFLVDHGFLFLSVYLPDGSPVRFPAALAEAKRFVKDFASYSAANRLGRRPTQGDENVGLGSSSLD